METFSRHCIVKYSDTSVLIIAGVIGTKLFSQQTFFYDLEMQLLQPGVNFINISGACFLYVSTFLSPKFHLKVLRAKILYKKCARKMLMKLTTGPALHNGRQLHSCAMIDSKHVLVAGGRDFFGGLDSVEILDVETEVILPFKLYVVFKIFMFAFNLYQRYNDKCSLSDVSPT